MLTLDGSMGEGGGQILRTALGLSLLTGTSFRIENIRARRKNPGLQRQHLAAVRAACEVSKADVSGAAVGSGVLTFAPGKVASGDYHFAVGTAGSATLVLQSVLPALLMAAGPTTLAVEGGTHNPWAPPFDFLQKAFVPLIGRMGPKVTAILERRGFFPAGGGRILVTIDPVPKLGRLDLLERGEIKAWRATAIVASLPIDIARREIDTVSRWLKIDRSNLKVEEDRVSRGPGNVVVIDIESEYVTEVFTGFGQRGVRAEVVAERVSEEARAYLTADVPVGPYLADQLLIPLALAGGGSFRTVPLTLHSTTNLEVIDRFLGRAPRARTVSESVVVVEG